MDGKKITTYRLAAAFIVACFIIFVPMLGMPLDPNKYSGGRSRDINAVEERNRSAITMIIGEFRASISDMIFVKTEVYLHGGVEYLGSCMDEQLNTVSGEDPEDMNHENHENESHNHAHKHEHENGVETEGEHAHEHEHEHAKLETLIPEPKKDFRGIIGDLNREVKPWIDPSKPHKHVGSEELLPWYRLMTISDPHNIRAYYLGTFWLKRIDPDKAIEFATEGIKNNPKAFQIYQTIGQVYYYKATLVWGNDRTRPSPEARVFINSAYLNYKKAVELAIIQRPAGGPEASTPEKWNDYEEQDALSAARLYVLLERDYGDPILAKKRAAELSIKLGGDKILESHAK